MCLQFVAQSCLHVSIQAATRGGGVGGESSSPSSPSSIVSSPHHVLWCGCVTGLAFSGLKAPSTLSATPLLGRVHCAYCVCIESGSPSCPRCQSPAACEAKSSSPSAASRIVRRPAAGAHRRHTKAEIEGGPRHAARRSIMLGCEQPVAPTWQRGLCLLALARLQASKRREQSRLPPPAAPHRNR